MDDNYFDKKLKNILESPPDFKTDPSAFKDMQDRLRAIQRPKKNRKGLLLFLLPLLLLPAILGVNYFHKKYESLHQQIQQLNQKLESIQHKDTVVQQQIIQQYDTIYHTVYRETYIRQESTRNNNTYLAGLYNSGQHLNYWRPSYLTPLSVYPSNISGWSLGTSINSLSTYKNPGSSIFHKSFLSNPATPGNLSDQLTTQNFELFDLAAQSHPLLHSPESGILSKINEDIPAYKDGKIPASYYFTPVGLAIGVQTNQAIFPVNTYGGSGASYGINTGIRFPGNRSLKIGIELSNISFELKDEAAQMSSLPMLDPENPNDVLHELKGKFIYLQVPTSLQQQVWSKDKFQIHAHAGMVAYRPLQHRFVYEYINSSGEYKLESKLTDGAFSVDNLKVGIDLAYRLSNHFMAEAGVQYQHGFSLNDKEYFPLRFWAINLGLNYDL